MTLKQLAFATSGMVFLLCSCIEQNRIRTHDKVLVEDEIPGIGATSQYPDTCIAYYDKQKDRIYIKYISLQKRYEVDHYSEWHYPENRLTEPPNKSGYYVTILYFNHYDSIPIQYKFKDSRKLYKGYKFVFVSNGYYTDNDNTYGVIYDKDWRPINGIEKYRWKIY